MWIYLLSYTRDFAAGYGQYDKLYIQRDCPNRTIASDHLVISGGRVLRTPPTGLFVLMQIFYPVGEQLEPRYTRRGIGKWTLGVSKTKEDRHYVS